MEYSLPSLPEMREAARQIAPLIVRTPMLRWPSPGQGPANSPWIKLECLQHGGSFKYRAALLYMGDLSPEQKARGVTAVSAGNHAIAVAMAGQSIGVAVKVVMPSTANPFRIGRCERLGAEVVLQPNVQAAFDRVREIEQTEGRVFIHPFEGRTVTLGTATVALEMLEAMPTLQALVIPAGGGGLLGGMAYLAKTIRPDIEVWGVEPFGADTLYRSLAQGSPASIDKVDTIADSLGAPFAMPYSFSLVKTYVNGIVRIDDGAMVQSMRQAFTELKLALEPAGAASLAAWQGPLQTALSGKRTGLIACGSNIDPDTFFRYLSQFPAI